MLHADARQCHWHIQEGEAMNHIHIKHILLGINQDPRDIHFHLTLELFVRQNVVSIYLHTLVSFCSTSSSPSNRCLNMLASQECPQNAFQSACIAAQNQDCIDISTSNFFGLCTSESKGLLGDVYMCHQRCAQHYCTIGKSWTWDALKISTHARITHKLQDPAQQYSETALQIRHARTLCPEHHRTGTAPVAAES
jgi:hypothetical protein